MKQSAKKDSGAVSFTALDEVTITEPYAVNALEKELDYLLLLDADRLLADFRNNAGLDNKGKTAYTSELSHGDRWEGALIGGHFLGHYLSALGQAYMNAGTPAEIRTQILEKSDYIVRALKECQDRAAARGAKEGFLWGAEVIDGSDPEIQFNNLEQDRTDIGTQAWVPWYTMHKILQGLIDAYALTGNGTAKEVASKLGDWVYHRTDLWSEGTRARALTVEYGGMNDCLYNLYAITGKDEHAIAAHKFDETDLFAQILNDGKDYLNDKHANTTIPKIIGALNRYTVLDGKTVEGKMVDAREMLEVAEKFWDRVVQKHSYITGGNSEWEHFGRDNVLNAERTNTNCETCNTYNMLKLSRTLFAVTGDKKYLDFYENTYYNAIWSSQNPETGMTTYFQPMASGYFKVYSTAESSFWCCTGSGMESMTKLGDSIYFRAGNATYVSLYLDSTYKKDGLEIRQIADLENSDTVIFQIVEGETVLRLRRPAWSPVFEVTVGKEKVEVGDKDGFVSVEVKEGDAVRVTMQKRVTAHGIADGENVYAFKYGPFVLSAELGDEDMAVTATGVNVTIPKDAVEVHALEVKKEAAGGKVQGFMENIDDYMKRGGDGKFTLTGVSQSYAFSYHFRQYRERYAIYLAFEGD